jgi:hypothetical protein
MLQDIDDYVVKFSIIIFLSYKDLINLERTCHQYHKLLNGHVVARLKDDVKEFLPREIFPYSILTGGFLLALLTDGRFTTSNIDLVVCNKTSVKHIHNTIILNGWAPINDGFTEVEDDFYTKLYVNETGLVIKLNIVTSKVTAKGYVGSLESSISRIWYDGRELVMELPVETLNLNNTGYIQRRYPQDESVLLPYELKYMKRGWALL